MIQIHVGGELVSLHSCSHCDRRWWKGMDGSLTLANVLDLVARP